MGALSAPTIPCRKDVMSQSSTKYFLITGGAGFIGSALVRHLINETPHHVVVVDKLTYAGNLESLAPVSGDPRYRFASQTHPPCAP